MTSFVCDRVAARAQPGPAAAPGGPEGMESPTAPPTLPPWNWRFYHFDALGSTRLLTDASGTVTDSYSYDGWGNVTGHTGDTGQPYQFVGQLGYYTHYQIPSFGLLELGVRFYGPEVGRFTQRDRVDAAADGVSLYRYADDRPTVYVDTSGDIAWIPIIWGGIKIGLCIGAVLEARCIHRVLDEAERIRDRHLDKVAHCYAVCRLIRKCKLPADTAYYWATWFENRFSRVRDPLDNRAHLIGSDCASSRRGGKLESCYSCCLREAGPRKLPNY